MSWEKTEGWVLGDDAGIAAMQTGRMRGREDFRVYLIYCSIFYRIEADPWRINFILFLALIYCSIRDSDELILLYFYLLFIALFETDQNESKFSVDPDGSIVESGRSLLALFFSRCRRIQKRLYFFDIFYFHLSPYLARTCQNK